MGVTARKHSAAIVPMQQHGFDWLVGASELGVGIQLASVVLTGATTAFTFAALASLLGNKVKGMADASYTVIVSGNTVGRLDPTTRTVDGFSIVNGTNLDVALLVIIGRIAGMQKAV